MRVTVLPTAPPPSIRSMDRRIESSNVTYGADEKGARTAFARALEEYPGHTIYVGPGVYRFSGPVTIDRPVTLHLAPDARIIAESKNLVGVFDIKSDGVTIQGGEIALEHNPERQQRLVRATDCKDFSLIGTRFFAKQLEYNRNTSGLTPVEFVRLDRVASPTIRDCKFIPTYGIDCIRAVDGNRQKIIGNEFSGDGHDGVGGLEEIPKRVGASSGIWLDGGETFTVADNLFYGLGEKQSDLPGYLGNGIKALPEESLLFHVVRVDRSDNLSGSEDGNGMISNNVIHTCAARIGISLIGTVNVSIKGNTISNLDRTPAYAQDYGAVPNDEYGEGAIFLGQKELVPGFPSQGCLNTLIEGNLIHASVNRNGNAAAIAVKFGEATTIRGGVISGLEESDDLTNVSVAIRVNPARSVGFSAEGVKIIASEWLVGTVSPTLAAPVHVETGTFQNVDGATGGIIDGTKLLGFTALKKGNGAASLAETNTIVVG